MGAKSVKNGKKALRIILVLAVIIVILILLARFVFFKDMIEYPSGFSGRVVNNSNPERIFTDVSTIYF